MRSKVNEVPDGVVRLESKAEVRYELVFHDRDGSESEFAGSG